VKIQKAARGFLVRKQARNLYVLRRDAAVAIQSRARVVLSKSKMERARLEKETRQEQRLAATTITKVVRGVLRRLKFCKELEQYREVQAKKNELAQLQLKLEESERRKEAAVKIAEEKVRETMSRLQEEEESRSASRSSESSAATKLINHKAAMIEKMRSDNKRVRSSVKMLETKYKDLKTESRKLKEENDKAVEEFLQKNEDAKAMQTEIEKSMEGQQVLKQELTVVVDELKREHGVVLESVNKREKFQEAMAGIIKILRTQCRDEQLVEDAIMVALDSDTEAKATKAGFEALQASKMPSAAKAQVVSSVPQNVGVDADHSHTDITEDSTSLGSSMSDQFAFDEAELKREEAEMEAELRALELELAA